ncbi:ran binding protein 1, putative [Ichthyophthirius multifiliis]|uniref:Ran binding protein 1, putative n=1 Tax=Ichthyophthirius multifiliis TaxID=5932 RepID=G0R334_ICHMU|nr:ran binding protein 1, putative [Ichthyophthirius multifiliis]EGR28110.1 ran binding protein 1, putative [Ichthyophthirius multifiliis]|eukprot:XP_004027455.1 ran binding protein 1, putative [Ichthyophthirius multifiliis]
MAEQHEPETHEDVDENYDPEAECAGDFKPVQELPEVAVVTGEENEDVHDKFRVKLYRWRENELKERGAGDLKFLKNKETSKIRILMRQDKTHKIVANFLVQGVEPMCQLVPLKTHDKSWVWTCYDASDEQPAVEKLCGRFTNADEFQRFKKVFEETRDINNKMMKNEKKMKQKRMIEKQFHIYIV